MTSCYFGRRDRSLDSRVKPASVRLWAQVRLPKAWLSQRSATSMVLRLAKSSTSSSRPSRRCSDHFARSRVRWPLTKFCVDRPELSGSRQRPDPYFMADTLAVSHPRIGLILSMPVGSSPGQSGGSTGLNSQIGLAR